MVRAMRLSIIMPALDEGEGIIAMLDPLADLRTLGVEVVVVDGGSRDATVQRARLRVDKVVLSAPRGWVPQMNAGAEKASGDVLLFLDKDTRLPPAAEHLVLDGLARSGRAWGRFNVKIEGRDLRLPLLAAFMNLWSRLTGIATGEQAIFVKRDAFEAAGGFPAIPLMTDVALCKRLKRLSRPLCLRQRVVVPVRRCGSLGAFQTALLMWRLRIAFFFGAGPDELAKQWAEAGGKPSVNTGG